MIYKTFKLISNYVCVYKYIYTYIYNCYNLMKCFLSDTLQPCKLYFISFYKWENCDTNSSPISHSQEAVKSHFDSNLPDTRPYAFHPRNFPLYLLMNLQIIGYVCSLMNNLEIMFYKDLNHFSNKPLIQRSLVQIS